MMIGIDCRLWNESGVGRYIRNLVEQLLIIDKNNQYVLFILTKDRNEILNQAQPDQNDNFKFVSSDIRWHTVEEQLRFPSILNKEHLDLVHFPYVSVPIFYNKPFVVTIHDLIPYHFPTGEASTLPSPLYKLKLLGYKFVVSQAAKRAKKIISVSNATRREIVDHLGVSPQKVAVTYEGIDDKIRNSNARFAKASARRVEIRNNSQNTKYKILNTKYLLYVGNAYPHKNLERLIEAFDLLCHPQPFGYVQGKLREGSSLKRDSSQVSPNHNDMKLVLVGREDHFYKRLKEEVSKMPIGNSIVFFGEASDDELLQLYRNAKALIIPSLMEGFGLPALEAMANKCLILASDIPALREICGDCVVYLDPYNVEDIAKVMKSVCRNHSNDSNHYSDKIKEGLGRAKMFSWQNMAEETVRVYEKCFDR